MKNLSTILSAIALAGVIALACVSIFGGSKKNSAANGNETVTAQEGAIVYFDLDAVIAGYDMANELKDVFETEAGSIDQEVTRRRTKLEKDIAAFQEKINKGLMTQSVAEIQGKKLQDRQNEFQQYAAQKQQELAEKQQVMMNNIADAVKTFVDEYNAEKGYAMIISTTGGLLPAPVVAGSAELDITEDILEGLNAAYVKGKDKAE